MSLARVLAPLVSLMPMVLYRAVSPWRLPLTLWVVVAEAALPVAVSVMSVVRSLWAPLWFTASRTLLMLLVVGVGVSAANPHLLRFSQICPRLNTFWSFSLRRRNRRLAAQSQNQTYIFLICRI